MLRLLATTTTATAAATAITTTTAATMTTVIILPPVKSTRSLLKLQHDSSVFHDDQYLLKKICRRNSVVRSLIVCKLQHRVPAFYARVAKGHPN